MIPLNSGTLDEEAANAVLADLNGDTKKAAVIAPILAQKNALFERTKGLNDTEKFKMDVESRPAEVRSLTTRNRVLIE